MNFELNFFLVIVFYIFREIACLRPMNSEDSEVFIPVISVGTDIPLNRSLNDTPSDSMFDFSLKSRS